MHIIIKTPFEAKHKVPFSSKIVFKTSDFEY